MHTCLQTLTFRVSSFGTQTFLHVHVPGHWTCCVMVCPSQYRGWQVHGSTIQVPGVLQHRVTTGPGQYSRTSCHSPPHTFTHSSVSTFSTRFSVRHSVRYSVTCRVHVYGTLRKIGRASCRERR